MFFMYSIPVQNQDTTGEVFNGSIAYDDFEGQENTIFILKAISDNILFSHKFRNQDILFFFLNLKIKQSW